MFGRDDPLVRPLYSPVGPLQASALTEPFDRSEHDDRLTADRSPCGHGERPEREGESEKRKADIEAKPEPIEGGRSQSCGAVEVKG